MDDTLEPVREPTDSDPGVEVLFLLGYYTTDLPIKFLGRILLFDKQGPYHKSTNKVN